MRRLPDLTGKVFGRLTLVKRTGPGHRYICQCSCGNTKTVLASALKSGHTQSCGCYNKDRLSEVHTGHTYNNGRPAANKLDRIGKRYGKLVALKDEGNGRWLCQCDCGNTTSVLSTNLANMKKNGRGCRHCANREDIRGEKIGLLLAVEPEKGVVSGRPPLWTFFCECGNTIQGTVREFHAQWLRSCGCHENAHASWACMMNRCYNQNNNRYNSYGGRGIKVCERWHSFDNFIADMGECPKRHNLGRKKAEEGYSPENCFWEHVSLNCRDTKNNGGPTKPGKLKGARPRI